MVIGWTERSTPRIDSLRFVTNLGLHWYIHSWVAGFFVWLKSMDWNHQKILKARFFALLKLRIEHLATSRVQNPCRKRKMRLGENQFRSLNHLLIGLPFRHVKWNHQFYLNIVHILFPKSTTQQPSLLKHGTHHPSTTLLRPSPTSIHGL